MLIVAATLLVCLAVQAVSAGELSIRSSVIGDWEFSFDGGQYLSASKSTDSLFTILGDINVARAEVRAYCQKRSFAKGIGSLAMGTFVLGVAYCIANDDHTSVSTAIVLGGAFGTIVAVVSNQKAGEHLRKAADIYNEGQRGLNVNVGFQHGLDGSPRFGLVLNF